RPLDTPAERRQPRRLHSRKLRIITRRRRDLAELLTLAPAQQGPQHAPHDLPSDTAADGACCALGGRFHYAIAAATGPSGKSERQVGIPRLALGRTLGGGLIRPALQPLVGRLAIDCIFI